MNNKKGGWYTQGGIGILLVLFVLVGFFTFFVDIANNYEVPIEPQYQSGFGIDIADDDSVRADTQYIDQIYQGAEIQEGGNIDSGAQDAAQSPSSISAIPKINFFSVLRGFFTDLINIFPYNPMINVLIFAMIGFISFMAFAALFTRRNP